MTQKVFDVENEKDMDLLWSILPDDINKIKKHTERINHFYDKSDVCYTGLININWYDKTEITRPVNYEDMIGCVGYFYDEDDKSDKVIGILKDIINKEYPLQSCDGSCWKHFTPAKKSELKFYEYK